MRQEFIDYIANPDAEWMNKKTAVRDIKRYGSVSDRSQFFLKACAVGRYDIATFLVANKLVNLQANNAKNMREMLFLMGVGIDNLPYEPNNCCQQVMDFITQNGYYPRHRAWVIAYYSTLHKQFGMFDSIMSNGTHLIFEDFRCLVNHVAKKWMPEEWWKSLYASFKRYLTHDHILSNGDENGKFILSKDLKQLEPQEAKYKFIVQAFEAVAIADRLDFFKEMFADEFITVNNITEEFLLELIKYNSVEVTEFCFSQNITLPEETCKRFIDKVIADGSGKMTELALKTFNNDIAKDPSRYVVKALEGHNYIATNRLAKLPFDKEYIAQTIQALGGNSRLLSSWCKKTGLSESGKRYVKCCAHMYEQGVPFNTFPFQDDVRIVKYMEKNMRRRNGNYRKVIGRIFMM